VRSVIHERDGIELAFEIEFVGDWSGWVPGSGWPGHMMGASEAPGASSEESP